jgi:hypothetical protein
MMASQQVVHLKKGLVKPGQGYIPTIPTILTIGTSLASPLETASGEKGQVSGSWTRAAVFCGAARNARSRLVAERALAIIHALCSVLVAHNMCATRAVG